MRDERIQLYIEHTSALIGLGNQHRTREARPVLHEIKILHNTSVFYTSDELSWATSNVTWHSYALLPRRTTEILCIPASGDEVL